METIFIYYRNNHYQALIRNDEKPNTFSQGDKS